MPSTFFCAYYTRKPCANDARNLFDDLALDKGGTKRACIQISFAFLFFFLLLCCVLSVSCYFVVIIIIIITSN